MKIKKFMARNFSKALELVKKEFGEDALILSTEEKSGIKPFVEITAAVDYDLNHYEGVEYHSEKREEKEQSNIASDLQKLREPNSFEVKTTEVISAELQQIKTLLTDDIQNEVAHLRKMIEGMKKGEYEISLPEKKMMLNFLRERSFDEEIALRLCENAGDLDDIPALIASDIKVMERDTGKRAVMFIGPTGVGKTTTIAKLTANAIRRGKKPAIISLDTYRIGAIEQIRIYSKIMGIPLSVVKNTRELKQSFLQFEKDRDSIFIDTTGKNPRDKEHIDNLLATCSTGIPLDLHLLMSANYENEFMKETYKVYRKLPVDYISFSKIDEAVRFGSIYNFLLTAQKPVAYLTTGQRVPDDIEFASVNKLSNLILKKGCYAC